MIPPNLSKELFLRAGSIIRMGIPPMRMTTISGVTFEDCFAERVWARRPGSRRLEVLTIAYDDDAGG